MNQNFPEPQSHREEAGRRCLWQTIMLVFAILVFAVASLYAAFIIATWADDIFFPGNEINTGFLGLSKLPGADSPPPEVGTIEDRINFLILGLDRRPWQPEDTPARTDTILILTVEPHSGSAGVFSIPRDLLVEIPNGRGGFFKERINEAYEYGPILRYSKGSAGLATDTIKHNFGIDIDYYAVLDFLDFVQFIDEIGGVDVNASHSLAAWYSLDDLPAHHVYKQFPAGPQHLDGENALAYVRIREGYSDLDRIQRQQQVATAAIDKALNVRLSLKARSLWDKFQSAVDTNIPVVKVPGLALLAEKVSRDKIVSVSLGEAVVDCVTPLGGQMLCPVPEKVEQLKRQVFFDPRLRREAAVVEVQNGAGQPGLATKVTRYLVRQGLSEGDLRASDASDGRRYEQTVIVDMTGKKYTAQKVAEWLGLPKERVRSGSSSVSLEGAPTADILIILGADARLPTS